jgi:hypothetical protein
MTVTDGPDAAQGIEGISGREDRHNRMQLGTALGQLRPNRVPETVYVNRSAASRIDEPCGDTCLLKRYLAPNYSFAPTGPST